MATTVRTSTGASPCDAGTRAGAALERTRFYPRQLVGPDDLTQDQIYFREKHRRHNRLLHGWGIVCGACVRRGRGDCEVIIEPGYLLGPYGDEILIDREVTIDVCRLGTGEQDGCCEEPSDPWCSDVRASCPRGRVYLAVRYDECVTRPVRHAGGGCGCGCDDDACEYSRVRDSYAVAVLRELPPPYTTPMAQPPITAIYPCQQRTARGCPPCPPEPWVILADIVMGDDCRVVSVDCFAHRRHVVSFAEFFFACQPRPGSTTGIAPGAQPGTHPGTVNVAHFMSTMGGGGALVDVNEALSTQPPRATVTMRRGDGSPVAIPAYFDVRAGETLGDLLNREGDRELYDPASGRAVTLRALYGAAGVAGSERLANAAAALALLEGRTLRAPGETGEEGEGGEAPDGGGTDPGTRPAEDVTEELRDLLDARALGRIRGRPPAAAAGLRASALQGIGGSSRLGERLGDMTIGDVAALSRDDFAARMTAGARGTQKRELEMRAREAWERARRIAALAGREEEPTDGGDES